MIIIGGCSAAVAWSNYIVGTPVVNTAAGLSDSRMIAHAIITAAARHLANDPVIVMQLTSPKRVNILTTQDILDRFPGQRIDDHVIHDDPVKPFWMLTQGDPLLCMDHFWVNQFMSVMLVQNFCAVKGLRSHYIFRSDEYEWFRQLPSDDRPWSQGLHDLVDWTRFWFHGETGGMLQWMEANDLYTMRRRNKQPTNHPSPEAHKAFVEQVLLPLIHNEV